MIPTEQYAQPNPNDIAGFEEFIRGAGDHPLSEMWTARGDIAPEWNLGQFSGTGWNFDPDNPYGRGILGDTIAVDAPVGQLYDTGDPRFLQDRYQDPYIAEDFPVGWTTPQNTWAGPEQLGGYWDALTNAERNAAGEIRSMVDRPEAGWAGPSVSPGTRGGGNVRTGGLLGPPNPAVPSFGFAGYQDWEPFMPTDFPLAAASGGRPAGWRYQPWVNEGMGGGAGGFAGPDLPQGYNPGGGLLTGGGGGTTGVPDVTYTPTNIWGDTTTGGNITTDTSGNQWVMSPGGRWYPADSDYGQGLLGNSRLFYDQHYDSSGAYVGAEGSTEWGEIKSGPHEGKMGWVDRHTGELEPRPAVGLQFPSDGQGFRLVDSSKLAYYQTEQGKKDPWAPAITNTEWKDKMGVTPATVVSPTTASSTPWGASAWDSVSDPYVNAYINDPSTGYDVSTGPTYEQRMAGIRNAQMVDARTRAEQAALAEQKDYEDLELARQALTHYSMGPNYGLLSGSARIGAGGVSDINAQINAAMVPQPVPAPLSISPRVAMPLAGNVPAGPTTAAAAALARLSQPQGIQWSGVPQTEAAIRAATIARQRETETEGRDAGSRGQQGSGMAGPGGGPGGW
jgi:hypothetical protein